VSIARKRSRLPGACSEPRAKSLAPRIGVGKREKPYVLCSTLYVLGSKFITFLLAAYLGISAIVVAADEAKERPVYIISPGDRLLITVAGHEKELTSQVVVRSDGMVTYPVVGDIKAAGLTIAQLSLAISEKLSALGYYEDPQVTVQFISSSYETIYVFGDVKDPGEKRFPESVNVVEALAAAGGFEETADLANAKVIKKRKEVVPVDLKRLLKSDIMDQGVDTGRPYELLSDRFMLEDGDIFIIPSAIKEERVHIIGHVHKPGQYSVRSTISLIEALALAGGPLETSADLKHIRIIKADGSMVTADATRAWTGIGERQRPPDNPPLPDETESKADPDPASSIKHPASSMVQPGDSVVVLERGKVNILGNVKSQGQFAVDDDGISVIEALTLAGIEGDSNLGKLRIVRSTGEQVTVDASEIWRQREQKIEEKLGPGDTLIVPRAFRINWSAVSAAVLIVSTVYAMFK